MRTLLMTVLKLFKPMVQEWWKAKDFSAKSTRALREIHTLFFMHVILFVFFLLSVEHGISVYAHHTRYMASSAHEVQAFEELKEKYKRLQARNESMASNYANILDGLDKFAHTDPAGFRTYFNLSPTHSLRREDDNNDSQ